MEYSHLRGLRPYLYIRMHVTHVGQSCQKATRSSLGHRWTLVDVHEQLDTSKGICLPLPATSTINISFKFSADIDTRMNVVCVIVGAALPPFIRYYIQRAPLSYMLEPLCHTFLQRVTLSCMYQATL